MKVQGLGCRVQGSQRDQRGSLRRVDIGTTDQNGPQLIGVTSMTKEVFTCSALVLTGYKAPENHVAGVLDLKACECPA